MTWREVMGRYRGSVLGLTWSFVTPILMLLIYTFVFSVVFGARWGTGHGEGRAEFAIVLFIGLMLYSLFADCVNRAPTLVTGNVNFVKRVIFPLELLPVVTLGSVLFHMLVSLAIWLVAAALVLHVLPWTCLLVPLVLMPLAIGTLGISWILASLGVFIRDIGQTVGIVTAALMFLSPIFFPLDALPEKFRLLVLVNPLTFPIEQAREVLIWGRQPDWWGLLLYWIGALAVAQLGLWWFQKTRKGFADVL